MATRLRSSNLEEFARANIAAYGLKDLVVTPFQTIEHEGRQALRYRVTGLLQGIPFSGAFLVVRGDGWTYVLYSSDGSETDSQSFFDAFHLLGGAVHPRAPKAKVWTDQRGGDWRVQSNVFESVSLGLSFKIPPAFRAFEPSVPDSDFDGTVQMADALAGLRVAVRGIRLPPTGAVELEGRILGVVRASGLREEGAPVQLTLGGKPIRFARFGTAEPDNDVNTLLGFHDRPGFPALMVEVDYERSDEEACLAEAAEFLGSIQLLDPPAMEALAANLAKPEPILSVGPTWSVRGRVARDFESHLGFRAPPGVWTLLAGDEAKRVNWSASIVAKAPLLGVTVTGMTVPNPDPSPAHRFQARRIGVHGSRKTFEIGSGHKQIRATVAMPTRPDRERAEAILSRTLGRNALLIHVVAPSDLLDPEGKFLAELSGGFFPEPRPAQVVEVDRVRDLRLGFEMQTDGAENPIWDSTAAGAESFASTYTISGGDEVLLLQGLTLLTDADWNEARLLERLLPSYANNLRCVVQSPQAVTSRATRRIAGRTGLSWIRSDTKARLELTVIRSGPVRIIFGDCVGRQAPRESLLAGFRWLED
ncbi:MAG: hypothetical protein IT384_23575 [Deltaproteobacteria bacterium]|nr:hypothetical protein [Deltaproteobacteria bacterium]